MEINKGPDLRAKDGRDKKKLNIKDVLIIDPLPTDSKSDFKKFTNCFYYLVKLIKNINVFILV